MMYFFLDRTADHPIARRTSPSPWMRTGAALRRGLELYLARRRRRSTIRTLRALSDRTLADIGLNRSEIESVGGHRAGAVERLQRIDGFDPMR